MVCGGPWDSEPTLLCAPPRRRSSIRRLLGDVVRRLPNPRGRSGAGVGAAVRVVATECTPANAVSPSRGGIARSAGARLRVPGGDPSPGAAGHPRLRRSASARPPPPYLARTRARARTEVSSRVRLPLALCLLELGSGRRAHPTRPPTRRVGARRVGCPYPHPRRDRRVPGAWSRGSALAA